MEHLTAHFAEAELGVEGADDRVKQNAALLCREILEPIREHYATSMHIDSGFRTPEHNAAVGGVAGHSQHLYQDGDAAADFVLPGIPLTQVFKWITMVSGLEFDQCILEHHEWPGEHAIPACIHISFNSKRAARRAAYLGGTNGTKPYIAQEVGPAKETADQ